MILAEKFDDTTILVGKIDDTTILATPWRGRLDKSIVAYEMYWFYIFLFFFWQMHIIRKKFKQNLKLRPFSGCL